MIIIMIWIYQINENGREFHIIIIIIIIIFIISSEFEIWQEQTHLTLASSY